jgi:hypothetical protein
MTERKVDDRITIVPNKVSPKMGIYDSVTGKSLKTIKMIDISSLCSSKKGDLKVIKYSRITEGVLFKMIDSKIEHGPESGSHIFFKIKDSFENSDAFIDFAKKYFKINPSELAQIIRNNSIPELD